MLTSEDLLTLSEAILLFSSNARKTDCILMLGCAKTSARTLLNCILFRVTYFLIFKGNCVFNKNRIIVKQ
jgi:hypothetical protein